MKTFNAAYSKWTLKLSDKVENQKFWTYRMEHVREVFSYYVVIFSAVSVYKIIDLITTLDLKTTIIAVDTTNELLVLILLWLYGKK